MLCLLLSTLPHTRRKSLPLFFYLLVSRVSPPPFLPVLPSEYAMKTVGSLLPTHFHNLVYRDRETETGGQRGAEFLLPVKTQLALTARERRTLEERKWLPLTVETEPFLCLPLTSPHSDPSLHTKPWLMGLHIEFQEVSYLNQISPSSSCYCFYQCKVCCTCYCCNINLTGCLHLVSTCSL